MHSNFNFKNMLIIAMVMQAGVFCLAQDSNILIETDYLLYAIAPDGTNLSFTDKKTGTDYLARDKSEKFAQIIKEGKKYQATETSYKDDKITVTFGESGIKAVIAVATKTQYFTLEVLSVSDNDIDEFTFVDIGLATSGTLEDDFPGCALALNLQTQIKEIPGSNSVLRAICYPRFGVVGSRAALIGCPKAQLRDVMKEVIEATDELPKARLCGPWAKEGQINKGSYVFNFSELTPANVDEWIMMAKELGMTQIDFHGGTSFTWGDYQLKKTWYPNGWDDMKAIVDKLHKANLVAGLHTYSFFVDKRSKWVTPVPDKRLAKDKIFTLATDMRADDNIVYVNESTEKMSAFTGYSISNSATLHIDDELILYTGVKKDPPYAFTGCKRGDCGTRVSLHNKGTQAGLLTQCYLSFAPDGDSTLFIEVADEMAKMYNYCGFDMIYFDAIDGAHALRGREYSWYYKAKFAFEVAKRLNKPALMDMSDFSHHLWYVRSRLMAWDYPRRGHKNFIDIHCKWYDKHDSKTYLPAFYGWGSLVVQPGHQMETTFLDDIEYLCCKCVGYDAGQAIVALNMGTVSKGITPEVFRQYPYVQKAAALIKQYEELRYSNYFSESIKRKLKVQGDEFTLEKSPSGKWQFRPVQYNKHKAIDIDENSKTWKIKNEFSAQPAKLRIEALWAAGPYDDQANVVLEDFNKPSETFIQRNAVNGVTVKLDASAEKIKIGDVSGCYSALNSDTANTGWSVTEKKFSKAPAPNLQAMGVWVYGDGKGELLNIKLYSATDYLSGAGDYFVNLDFKGWKYFELIEPEANQQDIYSWPNLYKSDFGSHSVYRNIMNFNAVDTLALWYNNIPASGEVKCYLSPIKALPVIESVVKNPSVTIGGKTITFPVGITSGSYIEFKSLTDCKLYNAKGEFVNDIKPEGQVPELTAGENIISFNSITESGKRARANVTVISQDDKYID